MLKFSFIKGGIKDKQNQMLHKLFQFVHPLLMKILAINRKINKIATKYQFTIYYINEENPQSIKSKRT